MGNETLHRCYFLSTGSKVCKQNSCPVDKALHKAFYEAIRQCASQKETLPDTVEVTLRPWEEKTV